MSNAASDTYLTCNQGATLKRDLTFVGVDVTTLTAMAFEICAYAGSAPLLTVTPTGQSTTVARVIVSKAQLTTLGPGCYWYYFRITTQAGEQAAPQEGVLRISP